MSSTPQLFALINGRFEPVNETDAGDYDTIIEVTNRDGLVRIEADLYYSASGVLRLEVTQPVPRAVRMFEALLARDAFEECYRL